MEKHNSKYRWVVFIAVLLSYFLIVTQRTAPGLITDQLMDEFQVTASVIGLLASVQFLAYAGLQIPIGILSDRFGPNFFLIVGTLLNGIGTLIYSLATNEFLLLFARLLVGMGDATIWINLVLILSQWFQAKEFVGLLGFTGMCGSIGFLMATYPFSAWIEFAGWRPPFLTVGILIIITGVLLYFVLVHIPKRMKPEKSLASSSGQVEPEREKMLLTLRRIFSSRQAWATFLCHFGVVGTYVGFIGSWAVPYGMHVYDMTRSGVSQLIMVGIIGAIFGGPVTSWMTNRLGTIKKPYIVVHACVFLSWATFLLFSGKPPFALLLVLFFIIGYGNGAGTLTFGIVRQSFNIKEVGVVSGFANTGGFLSAVLLPSIFGRVLDHFEITSSNIGYFYGLLIPVIFSLLGLVGGILVKEQTQKTGEVNQSEQYAEHDRKTAIGTTTKNR